MPSSLRRPVAALGACVAAIVTSLVSPAPADPVALPRPLPFVTVLERDWTRFDADNDGTLELDEIDHAVVDPTIKGDDAAVAAALKVVVRGTKIVLPPLTRTYFDDYEIIAKKRRADRAAAARSILAATRPSEAAIDDALRGDQHADAASTKPDAIHDRPSTQPSVMGTDHSPPDWELIYLVSRRRIANGQGGVWPDHGLSLKNMRQGPLGDCFFVSVIGAIVARDPAYLEAMVKPIDGGKFRVTFPTTQPITVGPLTDAEIAISSTTQGDGVWLAVLEQAFGRFRLTVRPTTQETIEAGDAIARGGSTGPTITALTGHSRRRLGFEKTLEARAQHQTSDLAIVRQRLIEAINDKRLITTGVSAPPTTRPLFGTLPKIPPGINTNHAYAILNYDPAADTIELWNPHGQLFKPAGPAGLVNGYPTEHGRFTVPLTEAYQFLTSITIETGNATTQTTTAPK